ncbi:MAG TPA: hypothetical protein VGP57_09085 [Actinoplanes sp.]|jgi:microsomal dipeptidase-like Zn-dependent dipeptidase|nr:hypothetical protein [Actinoplanes sp.]
MTMVKFARLGLVAVAVVVAGAGACSSGQSKAAAPEVATLTTAPTVASAAASPSPERPRRRLDDTAADSAALEKPFVKCMAAHGQVSKGWGEGSSLPKALKAAQEACKMLWPLPAWELDPANPEAKDFAREVVKCLRDKGVKHVETGENGIGVVAGDDSVTSTGKYLDGCQQQVAAHKK